MRISTFLSLMTCDCITSGHLDMSEVILKRAESLENGYRLHCESSGTGKPFVLDVTI